MQCTSNIFLCVVYVRLAWEIFEHRVEDVRGVRQIYTTFEQRLSTELKRLEQQAIQQWEEKCTEVASVSLSSSSSSFCSPPLLLLLCHSFIIHLCLSFFSPFSSRLFADDELSYILSLFLSLTVTSSYSYSYFLFYIFLISAPAKSGRFSFSSSLGRSCRGIITKVSCHV